MDLKVGAQRIHLVRGDITGCAVDAIVNAANAVLLGGGGVDGAIHRAAGPELLQACRKAKTQLPGGLLRTGGAVITPGFRLPARFVIHTVGPIYRQHGEQAWPLLASCYREALKLARAEGLGSIAFPSISTGAYGCPVDRSAQVALATIGDELRVHGNPVLVEVVCFDAATLGAYEAATRGVASGTP